jgi:antitoxin (DNA-binding transcriptional repressor) of toxin-antitoxin stability system
MAATEDIVITRNGKAVARLGSPYPDRVANAKSLAGIISPELNYEELKEERLERK